MLPEQVIEGPGQRKAIGRHLHLELRAAHLVQGLDGDPIVLGPEFEEDDPWVRLEASAARSSSGQNRTVSHPPPLS